jgi:hypothetical protein
MKFRTQLLFLGSLAVLSCAAPSGQTGADPEGLFPNFKIKNIDDALKEACQWASDNSDIRPLNWSSPVLYQEDPAPGHGCSVGCTHLVLGLDSRSRRTLRPLQMAFRLSAEEIADLESTSEYVENTIRNLKGMVPPSLVAARLIKRPGYYTVTTGHTSDCDIQSYAAVNETTATVARNLPLPDTRACITVSYLGEAPPESAGRIQTVFWAQNVGRSCRLLWWRHSFEQGGRPLRTAYKVWSACEPTGFELAIPSGDGVNYCEPRPGLYIGSSTPDEFVAQILN